MSGKDTESEGAELEDLESNDSDYDPNEASSDEEAKVLPSERARKQALEMLNQANEHERIVQSCKRQLPVRSNQGPRAYLEI